MSRRAASGRPEVPRRDGALVHPGFGRLHAVRRLVTARGHDLVEPVAGEHERDAVLCGPSGGELTGGDEAPEDGAPLRLAVVVRTGAAIEERQTVLERREPGEVERVGDGLGEPAVHPG